MASAQENEPIAQPVEHLTFNQRVDGSNPSGLTTFTSIINELRYRRCVEHGVYGLMLSTTYSGRVDNLSLDKGIRMSGACTQEIALLIKERPRDAGFSGVEWP